MKNTFITICFLFYSMAISQVAIGKSSITSNAPVSLEFYDNADNKKGLLLPWVSTVAGTPNSTYLGLSSAVDGTLIFDITDEKIKYRKGGAAASSWFDLTVKNKTDVISSPTIITNATLDFSHQNSLQEKQEAKVMIGNSEESDSTPGILILTDKDKAMILPKVNNPHSNIITPSAGMIAYDPTKNILAVFNGTVWTYWRAQ